MTKSHTCICASIMHCTCEGMDYFDVYLRQFGMYI